MRDRLDEIRARGAELVVIGNGTRRFAAAFREDENLDCPVLVDPELIAYRAAGLRRGRVELLSPRLPLNAVRALWNGHRQQEIQGDPWQLGGVLVLRPGGTLTYRHTSREAGDRAPLDDIVAALDAPSGREDHPEAPGILGRLVGRALSWVIDPTIVLSFDRTGFAIHSLAFDPDDLDVDLSGRRCVVTGANSGIGYETALALADLGAAVHLLCRSRARGEEAVARIREATGNPRVHLEQVDMSDLTSVDAVGRRLQAVPVDVLVHNAGLLPGHRIETADGLELTFATHVVGPFRLTQLLRPALERSSDGRIVWVSSGGMYAQRLALDDPNWERRSYDGITAYAETKRAQVVLSELWAEELGGTRIVSNAMHPGWADTPAVRESLPRFHRVTRAILRTPAEGADTVVWLAAAPAARDWTGRFFLDRTPRRTHFVPWTREGSDDRKRLWALCREACLRQGRVDGDPGA